MTDGALEKMYAKAAANRAWRARRAIAAGREPGRTGRPATGRKAAKHHGDRAAQRQRRYARLVASRGDAGWTATRHPIMDEAAKAAGRHCDPDRRTAYNDQRYEEALMTAALAILSGEDPDAAIKRRLNDMRQWAFHTAPLMDPVPHA